MPEIALRVRRKLPLLTAKKVTEPGTVELPDGAALRVVPGDYLVSAGKQLLDVTNGGTLALKYEVVHEGALTLSRAECQQIEKTAGIGATQTPLALLAAIERLAKIQVGEVRIDFTPGQLEEIVYRAGKRGRTVGQELAAVLDRIKDELFHRGG